MAETATEISAAGYTDLAIGQRIYDRWMYIEFRDGAGAKITRLPTGGGGTTADSRITHTIVDKKVTFVCAFSGSATTDTDIADYMTANSGSCTFKTAVLKKDNTDADTDLMASDDFTTATLADAGDTLTVTVSAGVGV